MALAAAKHFKKLSVIRIHSRCGQARNQSFMFQGALCSRTVVCVYNVYVSVHVYLCFYACAQVHILCEHMCVRVQALV